jgi:hypothetical protein
MAQGDLAGVSHKDVQADGDDAVNDDEIQKVNGNAQKVGLGYEPGQEEEDGKEDDGPNQNGFAFEKFNIFIIGPLDIHSPRPPAFFPHIGYYIHGEMSIIFYPLGDPFSRKKNQGTLG